MAKRLCGKRADNLNRPFWPLELSQSKGKIVCPWSQPPIFWSTVKLSIDGKIMGMERSVHGLCLSCIECPREKKK